MFKVFRSLYNFCGRKLQTQVFSDLSYQEIACPQLIKKMIHKPIHQHSRMSQRYLMHKKRARHGVKTCFSDKKTKVFKRINQFKRTFHSEILNRNIRTTISNQASRCIKKMGSFDTYILCTKPKDLDSKFGEYLREVMLRKINDPQFKIPYIIGSQNKNQVKKFSKYKTPQAQKHIPVPKEFKDKLITMQRKFGIVPEQFNEEDYKKYVELENLKEKLGDELDPEHPLIQEMKEKMSVGSSIYDQKIQEMARKAEEDYLNKKSLRETRRLKVDKAKNEMADMQAKIREYGLRKNFD